MGELEKVGQLGCVRSRGKLVSFFSFFFFEVSRTSNWR